MSQRCYPVALPHQSVISEYFTRCHLVSLWEGLVRKWRWAKSTTPDFHHSCLVNWLGKLLYSSLLLLITYKYIEQRIPKNWDCARFAPYHMIFNFRKSRAFNGNTSVSFPLTWFGFDGTFISPRRSLHVFALHLKIKLNNCSDNLYN